MLFTDFMDHNHRRTHKWYPYFPAYERHFARFRNQHVTLFEIGVGEGGSVQLWKRHLGPFARIVGIDVGVICKQVEEDNIFIRIGSQDDREFLAQVVAEFGDPDIVIDDGSHHQTHVAATFDFLYPRVAKNGLYVVEDLHAAYWPSEGGGLRNANSFIERAKNYVDEMHAEYTGGQLSRTAIGDRTRSIHFYDSIVVMEVGEYRPHGHTMTGDPTLFRADWTPESAGRDAAKPGPAPRHAEAAESAAAARMAQEVELLRRQMHGLQAELAALRGASEIDGAAARERVRELEAEVSALRASRSWRVTSPLRAIGSALKRAGA